MEISQSTDQPLNRSRRLNQFVCWFLAAILLVSGIEHGLNFDRFLLSIFKYRIFDGNLPLLVAIGLLSTMFSISVGLLFSTTRSSSLHMAAFLFGVFAIALASAWVRGIDISCGCLIGERKIDFIAVAKPILLALTCICLSRGQIDETAQPECVHFN